MENIDETLTVNFSSVIDDNVEEKYMKLLQILREKLNASVFGERSSQFNN